MGKKNALTGSLAVSRQGYTQSLIRKTNLAKCADFFLLQVEEGCRVILKTGNEIKDVSNEEPSRLFETANILKDDGEMYVVDITAFELVFGVYDIRYTDSAYGKPASVGVCAKCDVSVVDAKKMFCVFYEKLKGSKSKTVYKSDVEKTVAAQLKNALTEWLRNTLQYVPYEVIDNGDLEKEKWDVLVGVCNKVLNECGLAIVNGTFALGKIKFDNVIAEETKGYGKDGQEEIEIKVKNKRKKSNHN